MEILHTLELSSLPSLCLKERKLHVFAEEFVKKYPLLLPVVLDECEMSPRSVRALSKVLRGRDRRLKGGDVVT